MSHDPLHVRGAAGVGLGTLLAMHTRFRLRFVTLFNATW